MNSQKSKGKSEGEFSGKVQRQSRFLIFAFGQQRRLLVFFMMTSTVSTIG